MRAQAKRSSAASPDGPGALTAVIALNADATRVPLLNTGGSSARSRWVFLVACGVLLTIALVAGAGSSRAAEPGTFPARGYEVASWYPSGGVPYVPGNSLTQSNESGDIVMWGMAGNPVPGTEHPIPVDQQGGEPYQRYGSARGASSWQVFDYGVGGSTGAGGAGISRDGSRLLTYFSGETFLTENGEPRFPRMDPDDRNGPQGTDVYQYQPDGTLIWISRDPRIPLGTGQTAPGSAVGAVKPTTKTMSVDGTTVVFLSERQLSDTDTTPNSGLNGTKRLYKWQGGELTFIGARPDGTVPQEGSLLGTTIAGCCTNTSEYDYMVSRQGHRVVWSAERMDGEGVGDRTIYVQQDGAPTVEAVKETGVAPLPSPQPYDVGFRGAAADGSRIFFTSASRLTPDSGAGATNGGADDLYVYDMAANKVRDITPRLDGVNNPAIEPAPADQARVLDVAGSSDDGKVVYFVAEAQYPVAPNPEGQLPQSSSRNLYMATLDGIDDPIDLRFVATLTAGLGSNEMRAVFVSPDGSVLGFGSQANLVAGSATGGFSQVYVYDDDLFALDCASCPSDGSLPAGNVNEITIEFPTQQWQPYQNYSVKHWVSSSGSVFFHTPTALLPGDENIVDDVYEYRGGELRLISTGKSTRPSKFEDASRDGSTVFFNTLDALAPQDKEPGVPKLYAARVGGGFPFVAPPPPCDVNAGACEGPPSPTPHVPGAGTAVFQGPGDPKPRHKRRCPKGKHKVRTKGKTRCVKRCPKGTRKVRTKGKTRCVKRQHKRNAKHDRRASR